jgi:hypothetical protein
LAKSRIATTGAYSVRLSGISRRHEHQYAIAMMRRKRLRGECLLHFVRQCQKKRWVIFAALQFPLDEGGSGSHARRAHTVARKIALILVQCINLFLHNASYQPSRTQRSTRMEPVKRSRTATFSRKNTEKVPGILSTATRFVTIRECRCRSELGDESGVTVGWHSKQHDPENGAPNGTSRSNDFAVENARLYMSGHYGKIIKATFNTERTGGPRPPATIQYSDGCHRTV